MLSYFNQWGSLGPLMTKTVSTLHGDTRCVRTSSCFKCILNFRILRELWFSLNFRYNVCKCEVQCNAFTAVWFSFSSVFLLASSFWMLLFACLQFVLYVHVLYFLNSLLMLPIGWIWCIGGVVRSGASSWFWCLLELQYWVLSVLLNPSLSQGVRHWQSMLSWSKVMYRCIQHLLRDRLLALGSVLTAFHAFYR